MLSETDGLTLRRPIAFLYPPQPLECCAMPREYLERFPLLRQLYAEALGVLDWDASMRREALDWRVKPRSVRAMRCCHVGAVAFSWALTQFLHEAGIRPDVVFGHSLGLHSALVASGASLITDAIEVVDRTARFVMEPRNETSGGMLAVTGLTAEELGDTAAQLELPGSVFVSIVNSHRQLVVSGRREALKELAQCLRRQVWKLNSLPGMLPLHSPLMMRLADRCTDLVGGARCHVPHAVLLHPTSGEAVQTISFVESLWRTHLLSMIDFVEAMKRMESMEIGTYIEVGAGDSLTRLGHWFRRDLPIVPTHTPAALAKVLNARMA
jgi:malonyl CoA-acyl carrier protein transacylase